MTTSYIAINQHAPEIKQSMLDFSKPLRADDVIQNICDDDHAEATSKWHIDQALAYVFGAEIKHVFATAAAPARPEWVVIEELPADRGDVMSLPISSHDEVSIKGTYAVHEDIFTNYLKLNPELDFEERLWIVNGDQMTIDRIRSIQSEAVESTRTFDKRSFIVASPAWFHTDMNCAFTLLRTHWSSNDEGEHLDHCLVDDIAFWSLKGISNQKPKFFLVQSLLLRSFRSRVVAMFLQEMIDLKLLNVGTGAGVGVAANQGDMSHLETVKAAVRGLSPVAYLHLVDAVYSKAFTPDAWFGNPACDNSFTTMCRMLKEIELFMTVRRAVRRQDIGHLRRAVDLLISPFLGAGQNNYGKMMIYLRWLLDQDPVLQKAILAASVVNISGRRGKALAADELLEMHNLDYSEDLVRNANSTHQLAAMEKNKALCREAARVARLVFETGMSQKGSTSHSAKDSSLDVFSRADKLVSDGLARQRDGRSDRPLSADIQQAGIDLLEEKVDELNAANAAYAKGLSRVTDDPLVGADARERIEGASRGPVEDAVTDTGADEAWGEALEASRE